MKSRVNVLVVSAVAGEKSCDAREHVHPPARGAGARKCPTCLVTHPQLFLVWHSYGVWLTAFGMGLARKPSLGKASDGLLLLADGK